MDENFIGPPDKRGNRKAFLRRLGIALSNLQLPQAQVTPFPQSGLTSALQAIQGGASNFQNTRKSIEDEKVRALLNKIRFSPVAASAASKIAAGDTNLSPGEEAGLGFLGFNPESIPVQTRGERAAGAAVKSGTALSEADKQKQAQFDEDIKFRREEMGKNYELRGKEIDQRAKELGISIDRNKLLRDQLSGEEARNIANFRDSVAPQTDEQRKVWNAFYRDVYKGNPIDPKMQAIIDTIPSAKELTAEAAGARAQRKESEGLALLKQAVANKVGANSWEEAIQQGLVPQNILAAMSNLMVGNIAQRMAQGDKTVDEGNTAIRDFLGVDTSGFMGFGGKAYGNTEAENKKGATNVQNEKDELKSLMDRVANGEKLSPEEFSRAKALKQKLTGK